MASEKPRLDDSQRPRQNPAFQVRDQFSSDVDQVWSLCDGLTPVLEIVELSSLEAATTRSVLAVLRESGALLFPGERPEDVADQMAAWDRESRGIASGRFQIHEEPEDKDWQLSSTSVAVPTEPAADDSEFELEPVQDPLADVSGEIASPKSERPTVEIEDNLDPKPGSQRPTVELAAPEADVVNEEPGEVPLPPVSGVLELPDLVEIDASDRAGEPAKTPATSTPPPTPKPPPTSKPPPTPTLEPLAKPATPTSVPTLEPLAKPATPTSVPTLEPLARPATPTPALDGEAGDRARAAELYAQACQREAKREYVNALSLFRAAIEADSQITYLRRATRCALRVENLETAEQWAKLAAKLEPKEAATQHALAKVFLAQNRLEQAREVLAVALELAEGEEALARALTKELREVERRLDR